MTKFQVIEKGTEEGQAKLDKLYRDSKNGMYFVTFQRLNPQSDEDQYRAVYFSKLQEIADETGHSKKEMHEIIKDNLLVPTFEKDSVAKGSLSLEEWVALLKAVEIWAWQEYDVIIS
jgi:hypothetical protein